MTENIQDYLNKVFRRYNVFKKITDKSVDLVYGDLIIMWE